MAASVNFREPYTVEKLTLAAGVNVIQFPGLPQDGSVTIVVEADDAVVLTDLGADGDAVQDVRSIPLFASGFNGLSIPGMGREGGIPTIRLGDLVGSSVARVMLTRKA